MEHVITTYGGGEAFELVFNGIAALFKQDRTGMVMPLIRVGLMVGSAYILILMLFRHQIMEGVKWFLWVVIATNLLFLPKTTVFIHDPLTTKRFKVDHVPFALGAFASFVSYVGKTVTEKVESVFTLPDHMPYHKTGTVFASSLMSQVGQFRIVDPIFKGNMDRFVNQCVVYDAMIGHKYTFTELQNTPDIWNLVKAKASPVMGFLYKEGTTPGTIITCKAGALKLHALWQEEIKKATAIFGSRVQNQDLSKSAFFTHLHNGYQLLSGISQNAEDILRQEMMINAIEDASNNKLSELKASPNYAATKALLQQRSTYAVLGDIAARTLPLLKNVLEALCYALFIFIVVLALLPNGYKILLRYFEILVWTQLWAPLYAVLNLIMTLYGKAETMAHGAHTGLTLLNSSAIINANKDMETLAAWLAASIPFISYGIVKQGAGAFVGLAQHLGSAMQSAASGVAAETVSGNISLNNLTMGTQSYQNMSAFQHNTSPSYTSSQIRSMGVDGTEQITHGDGTQTFNDQAVSQLPVKIFAQVNDTAEQQQRLSQAQNVAQSTNLAAGKSLESASQHTSNFLSRVGKEGFAGETHSKSLTASEAKALQDYKNYIDDIRQSTGLNEAQAMEVAFHAKAGTPEWLAASAGISGNFSSNAARQQGIEAAQSIAKQKGYTDSLDTVLAAAKSLSEGTNDTKGRELAEGALASWNDARHLRDEASVAHSKVNEVSEALSTSQSRGIQETREITQQVLEYIASQPVNKGPGGGQGEKIGYRGARAIMERGGEEFQAHFNRFKEDHPQYSIKRLDVANEQSELAGQYATIAGKMGDLHSLQAHHAQQSKDIHEKGRADYLDLNAPPSISKEQSKSLDLKYPPSSEQQNQNTKPTELANTAANNSAPPEQAYNNFKEEIAGRISQSANKVKKQQDEITKNKEDLEKVDKDSKEKTLGKAVVGNLGKNAWGGVTSVAEDIATVDLKPLEKAIIP